MDWRKTILSQFVRNAGTRVWAVSDPDGLVRNERVMGQLQGTGLECIFFEDPIAFRYEYESRIRRAWEQGSNLHLVILFDERIDGFNALPSDVLESATLLEFGLGDIFPNCDASVLRVISTRHWDRLSEHLKRSPGRNLNRRETEELVLRLCYKLSPELIDSLPEFFRKLFDLHLSPDDLPDLLADRLDAELSVDKQFTDIAIRRLCADRSYFWSFLSEQWSAFLKLAVKPFEINDRPQQIIPFDDPLLRGYVGTFIDKKYLQPIDIEGAEVPENAWWAIGLKSNSANAGRIAKPDLEEICASIPKEDAKARDWIDFAVEYSRTTSELFCEVNLPAVEYFWNSLWPEIDERFHQWLEQYYSGLHNLPASPPVMQHHIPKQLNRLKARGHRVSLILLDGMSLSGWNTAHNSLRHQLSRNCQIQTSGVFAWLPSLTPICRQATFSGLAPRLFEQTIDRTDRDGARWKEFWEANGELRASEITHLQQKGDPNEAKLDDNILNKSITFGLTVEKPDKIMHGSSLGWTGWHQQIGLWAGNGYLAQIIDQLLAAGFTVCITGDHGNLEARGTGKISEGVIAESRGQRTRMYAKKSLRDSTVSENPDVTTCFDIPILPESKHILFAKGRGAFVTENEVIVTHGGASLDELIVPWVTIEANKL